MGAVAVLVVIVVVVANLATRDEGSYQYGRSALSGDAEILWKANRAVGSESGNYGTVHTLEDACRIVVDTSMDAGTEQAKIMAKMDKGDMLAGCTDVLENEVRLGYLPMP